MQKKRDTKKSSFEIIPHFKNLLKYSDLISEYQENSPEYLKYQEKYINTENKILKIINEQWVQPYPPLTFRLKNKMYIFNISLSKEIEWRQLV